MEKLHRFPKQKVLLCVKNGVCISLISLRHVTPACKNLTYEDETFKMWYQKWNQEAPWVKFLDNFYKPEQNQARWYLRAGWAALHIGKSCVIRTCPARFSLFYHLLHVWLVTTLHTNRTLPVTMTECRLMCNVPNGRSVVVTSARGTLLLASHNRCAGLFTCTKQEYRIIIQAGNWLMFTPPLACPSSPAWHICSVH